MTGDREYVISGIRRLKGRTFKALLGKGDSGHTVAVTGKANYVWVRVKYGSSLGAPVQALNRNVPPIHGRVVRVKEIDRAGIKGYEVIDFDDTGTPYYHDDTGHGVLPKHGWTHECSQDVEATDPVNLYTRCWAELRVEPTDPCSMYTYVTHGWYMCEIPQWFPGGNSPLFTAPAAGTSRYDLVYIDCSGTIGIEQGDDNMPALGGPLPEPPDFTIPLAAILFTGTAGCIEEDMILDCRVMPNLKYPPGGARFDDSITPSTIYPDAIPWTGAQDYPSRTDHRHGITCATPSSIGSANAEGVGTAFTRQDHIHQGVHSLAESGQAALYGDITLSEGNSITLTEVGQNIEIALSQTIGFVSGTCTGYFNIGEDLTVAHNIYAADGYVGIGTTSPAAALHIVTTAQPVIQTRYSDGVGDGAGIQMNRTRGTVALPAVVQSGDWLGNLAFRGWSAAAGAFVLAAKISGDVDGEPDTAGDPSDMPGRLEFWTTPDGTNTNRERLRIDNAGYCWFNPYGGLDTNLYRSAANILKTDDEFWAVGPLTLTDGIVAPGALAGAARIYVDVADGDLKVVFADGFVATIAADS